MNPRTEAASDFVSTQTSSEKFVPPAPDEITRHLLTEAGLAEKKGDRVVALAKAHKEEAAGTGPDSRLAAKGPPHHDLKLKDGRVTEITRDNGTTLKCSWDQQGNLLKLTIGNKDSYSRPDKDSPWTYTFADGRKERFNGQIEVKPDGTCVYSSSDSGLVESVRLDGSSTRQNPDKSKLNINARGQITDLKRADGTTLALSYTGATMTRVTVTQGSEKAVWNKDPGADRWRSMSSIGSQLIRYKVHESGETTYEDTMGTQFTIHGDATQTRLKTDGTRIELTSGHQPSEITTSDGVHLSCQWSGDTLKQVTEKSGAVSTVWERQGNSDTFTSTTARETRENFTVNAAGEYAYVSSTNGQTGEIRYIDGSMRSFAYANGRLETITEKSANEVTVWKRDGDTDNFTSAGATEERKDLTVTVGGDYSFDTADGARHTYHHDGTEEILSGNTWAEPAALAPARAKLEALADQQITNADELSQFKRDLSTFERRAAVAKLADDRVATTFAEISLLLAPPSAKTYFNEQERKLLAQEVLHHVAFPRGIDQGWHNTCGAASVEVITAALEPEKFAQVVRQVADSGKFKTTGNLTVAPDKESLMPDFEGKVYRPFDQAKAYGRSWASQIFQVVGINAAYQGLNSNQRYRQLKPGSPTDTGERIVDAASGKTTGDFTGMYGREVQEMSRQISGHGLPLFANDGGGTGFTSAQDLEDQLSKLQEKGALPAILQVHTRNQPFWDESGAGRSGSQGTGHFLTVWQIDRSRKVLVDNQWGRRSDYEGLRRLTGKQLFETTIPH